MPEIIFRGSVLPEHFSGRLNINGLPSIRCVTDSGNNVAELTLDITESKVSVRCRTKTFDAETHLSTLSMHAYNIARAAVDSWCFSSGIGLMVHLGKVVHPNGEEHNLAPQAEHVLGLCTAFNLDPSAQSLGSYQEMVRIIISDQYVLMALNDLVASIHQFDLAAINCARAIEALRTSMTPSVMDRFKAWPIMQANLNLTERYLTSITAPSAKPRHGARRSLGGTVQAEIMKRAWIVMNRFLEFRKRGDVPLPEQEFRVLDLP